MRGDEWMRDEVASDRLDEYKHFIDLATDKKGRGQVSK